jgi:dGTPase
MRKRLRIFTQLEQRYAEFDGLNLTWETLEGMAKHNGPVKNPPRAMKDYIGLHDLQLQHPCGAGSSDCGHFR